VHGVCVEVGGGRVQAHEKNEKNEKCLEKQKKNTPRTEEEH
jgi:hypothetical protein